MRRLLFTVGVALTLATVVVTGTQAAPENLRVTEMADGRFPERSFLLTLPNGTKLAPEDVVVTENGKAVSDVSLVPASNVDDRRFGLVLLVDASNSMRGEPIEQAMAATRAFAEHRNDNQEIAVIAFNSQATVLLPFTADAATIEETLRTAPPLASGTRLYDALDEALALVESADLASASIVVLSDGNDIGSTVVASTAIDRAKDARVRIFSVGLRSPQFSARALRQLGEGAGAGGTFVEASSPDQLRPILDALGAELAREYLLRYRSLAGPGADVEVVVRVEGFSKPAKTGYRTPELPGTPAKPSFATPVSETFWGSAWAMLLAATAASTLAALAVAALFGRRRAGLVSRVSAFVSVSTPEETRARSSLHSSVLSGTERSLARMPWWARFCEEIEIGKIRLDPVRIVLLTIMGTVFVSAVLYMLLGALFAAVGLAIPLVARALVKRSVGRQRKLFADQLPDNLQVLGSAMRAGHSFVAALSVVVEDAAEPSRTEFRRVIADERLGVPLEDALDTVARRMESRDVSQVALVAAVQRMSGGNSAEVLDRVAETVRERGQLRRLVQSLTAQGRMARWIVSLLPLALLGALSVLNRAYIAPLFTEPSGRIALLVAGVMVVIGSLVIKRIVNIRI